MYSSKVKHFLPMIVSSLQLVPHKYGSMHILVHFLSVNLNDGRAGKMLEPEISFSNESLNFYTIIFLRSFEDYSSVFGFGCKEIRLTVVYKKHIHPDVVSLAQ